MEDSSFMKFLIKLLHILSFSTQSSSSAIGIQNGTIQQHQQQQQQKDNDGNDLKFGSLPPFAYTTAMIFFIQLFSVIFVLNIEEFSSPLVMFSYWRNKIS
jgi:hypothetical protein